MVIILQQKGKNINWGKDIFYQKRSGENWTSSCVEWGGTTAGHGTQRVTQVKQRLDCNFWNYKGFPSSSAGKESTWNAGDSSSIPGLGRSTGEEIGYPLPYPWSSLVVQLVICLQCGRPGFDPCVGKIPCRRERLPTPVFRPGEFHGLCSPSVHKE